MRLVEDAKVYSTGSCYYMVHYEQGVLAIRMLDVLKTDRKGGFHYLMWSVLGDPATGFELVRIRQRSSYPEDCIQTGFPLQEDRGAYDALMMYFASNGGHHG